MPNNSGRAGSSSFYQQWLNSQGSSPFNWETRTAPIPRPSAPPEPVRAEQSDNQAEDENFALPAGSHSHVIHDEAQVTSNLAPSDPMVPHESDTAGIRGLRQSVVSNPTGAESAMEVLRTLTGMARRNFNDSRGQASPPPSMFGEAPTLRRSRSRGGESIRREPESTQTFFGNVPESSTMTTVAQIFGHRVSYPTIEKHPFIVGTNLAGVEIELENLNIEHPSFNYWTAKSDGSLRNAGMEFVCSHPWGGVDLYNAALEIDGFLFNNNPEDTWRCSTHVHVDVRDMTVNQLKKMILAYVFFERVLFKCSGWHRYKNNFCVALGFAQGQLDDLANWWALDDNAFCNRLVSNWDKYTAINFLPMSSFGSVEFRISEAKWHKGQLIRLTNRFLSLKEIACENDNMTDEQFIEHLLSSEITDVIRKGVPRGIGDIRPDIEIGYKLAYDIISLAKLRRRSRRLFTPDLEDGSRIMTNCSIFSNGWSHCRSHLTMRYPDLEFPEHCGTTITFKWLYELRKMMQRHRLTFEAIWFMPEQNREQLKRLFRQYVSERNAEDSGAEPVPEAPTRSRNNAGTDLSWMDEEPDFSDDDGDHYDSEED